MKLSTASGGVLKKHKQNIMQKKLNLGLWSIIVLTLIASASTAAERLAAGVPIANIRSGPGTTYEILWQIQKYHPLLILKTTGSWCYFRDFEGDQGWIHRSLVDKTSTIITKKIKSNVRSGPGTTFKILFTVEKGVPFKMISRKGDWINIQHADGDRGWIHQSLVW